MKKIFTIFITLTLLLSFTACSNSTDDKTIIVGASPAPHAEILEFVKPMLEKEGYTLEIKIFTDYILPNSALAAGELDANFFQHQPFLNKFNEKKGTDIVSAAVVHFEPLGIYPGKSSSLSHIPDGAEIAIPNDSSNEARALKLLEANGIIKLKDGVGLAATPQDIVENPYHISIKELDAASVAINIQDVDFGVINGNYAIEKEIVDTVLITEDPNSAAADEYANIIAVLSEDLDSPKIKALVKAVLSDATRDFIKEKYGTQFVAKF